MTKAIKEGGGTSLRRLVMAAACLFLACAGPNALAQTFNTACASPTLVDQGGSASYNLNPGDVLLVTPSGGSGVFSGSINNFPAGATICVDTGATFTPTTFNNAAGSLYVRGTAGFPNVALNAGFQLDNAGQTSFSAGVNLNGEADFLNRAGATLEIASGTNLSFIRLDNRGTLEFPGGLNLNSGMILNSGDITVSGPVDIGGTLVNTHRIDVDGLFTINGNGDLYNSCVVTVNADAIFDSDVNNVGLVLVDNEILVDGGSTITLGPRGAMTSEAFILDGQLAGSGSVRVEGHSENQGSALGNADDPLNFYDVTQSNPPDFFDLQTGAVSNVERVPFDQPDPDDETLECRLAPHVGNLTGSITIVKDSGDEDGAFAFDGDLGAFSLATSAGTASRTFDRLRAGQYAVTELPGADWTLDALACDDGSTVDLASGTATVDLGRGEDVTCTFTNSLEPPPPGTLVIAKLAIGGDDSFTFSGDLGDFDLDTTGGRAREVFSGLASGDYQLTETLPAGWDLASIRCSADHSVALADNSVTVTLADGQGALCAFVNEAEPPPPPPEPAGTIVIAKRATGGDATFAFTGDLGAFELTTVDGSAASIFTGLEGGTYQVLESPLAGWTLQSASCTGGEFTAVAGGVALTLPEDGSAYCEFANLRDGAPVDPRPVPLAPWPLLWLTALLLACCGLARRR